MKDSVNSLRYKIAKLVYLSGEGHIPSSYSILEILDVLYGKFLKYNPRKPDWEKRDYFVLSKGHGSTAFYVVLNKYGFITDKELNKKSNLGSILGGHPDSLQVPGAEVSSGSLGHGVVTALGIALGLRIRNKKNRVIALIGDGESNEGTVWETALVASNLQLGNLLLIMDRNFSTDQILKMPEMEKKWKAFGWEVHQVDGHDQKEIEKSLKQLEFKFYGKPKIIIAKTVKGKGISFTEGHGLWHHKIPTLEDLEKMKKELKL